MKQKKIDLKEFYYRQELKKKQEGKKYDPYLDTQGLAFLKELEDARNPAPPAPPDVPVPPVIPVDKKPPPVEKVAGSKAGYNKGYKAGYEEGRKQDKRLKIREPMPVLVLVVFVLLWFARSVVACLYSYDKVDKYFEMEQMK